MPPTIGAASLLITSEPVPVPNNMGSKPTMVALAVITTGLTRSPAPCAIAKSRFS